uniref:Nuclear receptor domain-containing protein n=1 Tax=Panagrellus redivivus TaxID=6233 RepID=A0A7E4UNG1_PANRE
MKTTMKSTKGPCRICGAESSGFNFGVLTCKPCASFFRRCIAERKKYICRSGNACVVEGQQQRQSCRACRLRICIEVGMSRDLSANTPICAVPSAPSSPTNTILQDHSPATSSSNLSAMNSYTNLNWMLNVWRNFQVSQRALLAVVHPEYASMSSIYEPQEDYRFVMKAEYERIEMGSVALLMTTLQDNFPVYKSLPENVKNTVYRRYNVRFAFLQRIFLTSKVFPQDEDDRLVFFAGVYCTVRDLGIFYGEDSQSQLVLNVQRLVLPFY